MPFVYYNVAAGDQIAEISERMAMAADMKVRRVRQQRPGRTAVPAGGDFLQS